MRAAMLAFLLLATGCALIPRTGTDWLSRREQRNRYCESARKHGWVGPLATKYGCGVDDLHEAMATDNSPKHDPCAVMRSYWAPSYSENRFVRRLQVLKLWPMGRVLVFTPGPGMVRPNVNDPSACPG